MDGLRDAIMSLSGPAAVDLLAGEEAYLLVIDLPGATPETTTVSTTDGLVRIVANRSDPEIDASTVISDGRPPTIELELPLPDDVRDEEASASLANGVMEIRLPRGLTGTTIPIEES